MSVMTHDLLVRGKAAAKAGENDEAIRYLTRLLRLDPTPDEQAEAWHWLTELSTDPAEQRSYLDELLARNPGDARARRKIAALNGDLNPAEVVDPDRLPARPVAPPLRSTAQRFSCPSCGGRMGYSADGKELVCENCGTTRPVGGIKSRIEQRAQANFAAAMATKVGHVRPTQARVITCQGCGAEFQLPAKDLSSNCPYCGANYAAAASAQKEIVPPGRLIPFKVSLQQVREVLKAWFGEQGHQSPPVVAIPSGVYVPVWEFVVGGMLSWTCSIQKNNVWTPLHDSKVLHRPQILVFATSHLPSVADDVLLTYDLKELVPYNAHYLADWMAETYQVPVGDASLTARQIVLDNEKEKIEALYDSRITNLKVNTASMTVDSYQLLLLPLWLTQYEASDSHFELVINGQNGKVIGQRPAGGIADWISNLFNPR